MRTPDKIYVTPNNLRENQHNCAFFCNVSNGNVIVTQFDVKGDKDKVFNMSNDEFNNNFKVLSYHRNSSLLNFKAVDKFGILNTYSKSKPLKKERVIQ